MLRKRLAREIAARFDWQAIADEARKEAERAEVDEEGRRTGFYFLGTVFSIMPSGKFYMPFACSNVSPCESCKGTGEKANRRADEAKSRAAQEARGELTRAAFEKFGAFNTWPRDWQGRARALDAEQVRYQSANRCRHCGGCGSREAYLDQVYNELLSEQAAKFDLFVDAGEGDPCDLFAVIYLEATEEGDEGEGDEEDEAAAHCPADGTDSRGRCLGDCRECGAHLLSTGRYTVYCPDCDTCPDCGCPRADGFEHYEGCETAAAEQAERDEAEQDEGDEEGDEAADEAEGDKLKCPKCSAEVWDKATIDQRLNKCWGCGLRFDSDEADEEGDAPALAPLALHEEGQTTS